MKRFLIALMAATMVAMPVAVVHADTFTAAEQALAAKLVYEVPATQKAMRDYVVRIMVWLNTIPSVANVVTNATGNAAAADYFISSAGANKTVKSSGVLVANVPTMSANGGAGNLVYTAAGTKALGDASIAAANVVTSTAGGILDGNLAVWNGATKSLKDGGVPAVTAYVSGAAPTVQAIGAMAPGVTHVGDGTCAVTGTPKRTGLLRAEVTTAGDSDGSVGKFKWSFQGEALSGALDIKSAGAGGTALGTTGLTLACANGTPGASFPIGDFYNATATSTVTINKMAGIITVDWITPGNGGLDSLTLTNSNITANTVPVFGAVSKGTTTTAPLYILGWTAGPGSLVLNLSQGDATLDGTVLIPFILANP